MGLDGLDVLLAGNWRLIKDTDSPLLKHVAHDVDDCLDNEKTVRVYNSAKAGLNFYRREALETDNADGVAMGPREVEMAASGLFFLRDSRPEGDALLPSLPVFASPEDAGGATALESGCSIRMSGTQPLRLHAKPSRTVHLAITPGCCCGSWIVSP